MLDLNHRAMHIQKLICKYSKTIEASTFKQMVRVVLILGLKKANLPKAQKYLKEHILITILVLRNIFFIVIYIIL